MVLLPRDWNWPQRPVDPDNGVDEGGYPDQGPVLPGRPGELPPMPRLPVFYALPIEDWMRVPTRPPREPGLYCLVYLDDEHTRALGWLQGRSR